MKKLNENIWWSFLVSNQCIMGITDLDLHHLSQIEMRATKLRSIRRNRFWINSILMTFVNML